MKEMELEPHILLMGVVEKMVGTLEDGKIVCLFGLFIPAASLANICRPVMICY